MQKFKIQKFKGLTVQNLTIQNVQKLKFYFEKETTKKLTK